MSKKCDICGKGPLSGNKVSHSKRHTRTKQFPNLQMVNILLPNKKNVIGKVKSKVCTSCLKSNKIVKA